MYFPYNYTFRDLKIHIAQLFNFMRGVKEEEIRLWKFNGNPQDPAKHRTASVSNSEGE